MVIQIFASIQIHVLNYRKMCWFTPKFCMCTSWWVILTLSPRKRATRHAFLQ